MNSRQLSHFSPGTVLFFSVIVTIILGTVALSLPIARNQDIPYIDLLFTATSATCVTGLMTFPLDSFTDVGLGIILILIQIGGLGIITLAMFLVSLFVDLGFGTQILTGQLLELERWKNIKQFLIFTIIFTLVIETVGTLCVLPVFMDQYPLRKALFFSLFHAVSAFCSAGFTPYPGDTMAVYATNYIMLWTTGILMLVGSFGFFTWHEAMNSFLIRLRNGRYKLSLHSKIVIWGVCAVTTVSAILFWIIEHTNLFAQTSLPLTISTVFFYASSLRGGFTAIDMHYLHPASLLLIMIISFIGASPGSTSGGIKITTLAVILATIKAAILGRSAVELRGRSIPKDQVFKAISIVSLTACWITFITFCLLLSEPTLSFFDLMFESISAFCTQGLSMGVTPHLSSIGKICIMMSMIVGRVGSLALILALRKALYRKEIKGTTDFSYPEERILLS